MVILILAGFYFLPAFIAFLRAHQQATPILLLNLFLGWTVIGWVCALVWSATTSQAQPAVIHHHHHD
jgi:ABC-type transport system involved in cytochrome c biogenesis permease component